MEPAEINQRLAEWPMGWRLFPSFPMGNNKFRSYFDETGNKVIDEEDWNPYELITHTFEIVEKMTLPKDKGGLGYYCRIEILPLADTGTRYLCTFYKSDERLGFDYRMDSSNSWKAHAATLSAAISLAVLEAKGERG